MEKYIPTGNEQLSLPKINEATAGIEDFTFLHMGYKGLIDVRGSKEKPLIIPKFWIDNTEIYLTNLTWQRIEYWIPQFKATSNNLSITGTYLTPISERGFIVKLKVKNDSQNNIQLKYGLSGSWISSWHCVNEDKEILADKFCYESLWNDSLIFDMRLGTPLFSFAPMPNKKCQSTYRQKDNSLDYDIIYNITLKSQEEDELIIYWGLGFEEVASATSAKEMLRQGFDYEFNRTCSWLKDRSREWDDRKLTDLYNTNVFFCIFYSTGITLDTEEFVLVTSRSPRYYVSAAYWDRDSFFWSFPAILKTDKKLAKQMLEYAFGRQKRNLGIHSRYIDGTVLEPGFELDELVAPLIALIRYVNFTKDNEILEEIYIKKGIEHILDVLSTKKHPNINLYETFLQPTDDEIVYPYLTYNNVLVWNALLNLSKLMPKYAHLKETAGQVYHSILEHCIKKDKDGNEFFAWSVDLCGNYDIYDEPPGSLLLLPYLDFCQLDNKTFVNTFNIIKSPDYKYSFAGYTIADIGCAHAPHPWMLSVANSILCGKVNHGLDILRKVEMDNLIACESVDENTGKCTTGEAFATCAGFVCYALALALDGGIEDAN